MKINGKIGEDNRCVISFEHDNGRGSDIHFDKSELGQVVKDLHEVYQLFSNEAKQEWYEELKTRNFVV